MESWLAANANLLSALAGLVTLISIIVPPLVRKKWGSRRPPAAAVSAQTKVVQGSTEIPLIASLAAASSGPGAIAVMPFDSISSDPNDAYLADGISCEIISALSRAGYLHIAPRAACFALRDKGLALAELSRQLAVRYVVHGSVRHDGDKLRVIAEFADSASGRLLWSKTYERKFADILKVQEEIAQAIASSLGGETFRAEILNLAPDTNDTTAWSLTQRARHDYMLARGPESIKAALELVRTAVQNDPDYALAHAVRAQLLMDLVSTAAVADSEQAKTEARAAIEHALALASNHPEVLMFAGRVWVELGEREKSVAALRRGTQLSPFDLLEWGFLARALAFGDEANAAEAIAIAVRIIEIAPEHPARWTWALFKGIACMNLARPREALPLFRQVVEASPKFVRGWMFLASALGTCDEPEQARAAVAQSLQVNSNFTPQRFATYVSTLSGNSATTARLTAGLTAAQILAA